VVTHDIGEAAYLADTLVLLREGRIEQQGVLADLVQRPASDFVRQFINAQRSPLESLDAAQGPHA
jgi:osmoprotectant transport system ATP-binding protein